MRPVVVRHPAIILLHRQREPDDVAVLETLQAEQVGEHVDGLLRLLEIVHLEGIEVVTVNVRLRGHRVNQTPVHFVQGARVVVTQHFQGDAVLLLGPSDLVVEFRVVQRQTAVHGKHFKCFLVLLGEVPRVLVDHLNDADYAAPDEDGHAEDRLCLVARYLVDRAVEPVIRVGVLDIQDLAGQSDLARDSSAQWEANLLGRGIPSLRIRFRLLFSRGFTANVEDCRVEFLALGVYQEQRRSISIDETLSKVHDLRRRVENLNQQKWEVTWTYLHHQHVH